MRGREIGELFAKGSHRRDTASFQEGYSICRGTVSTLYWRAKNNNKFYNYFCWCLLPSNKLQHLGFDVEITQQEHSQKENENQRKPCRHILYNSRPHKWDGNILGSSSLVREESYQSIRPEKITSPQRYPLHRYHGYFVVVEIRVEDAQ